MVHFALCLSITLLVHTVLSDTDDAPTADFCADGWVNDNGFCYLVKDNVLATRREAYKDCKNHGAGLLTIETQAEMDFMAGELAAFKSAGWWTQMTRFRGVWKWSRSWPVPDSILQPLMEPDNAKGNENCAAVNEQMTFTDASCDQKYGFLCEVKQEGCPFGFLIGDDRCLFISDTFNKSQLMTKSQAEARCSSMGANIQLANLENQANIDYLAGELPENAQTPTPWWVSVTKTNGNWVWGTGDQATLKWAVEPDNVGGGEFCGLFANGKFADKSCRMRANYVCKKTDGSVPETPYDGKYGCGSWTRAGKKCYFFQSMFKDTPDGAQQRCKNVGADLLKIDTQDEKYWLDQMASFNYLTPFWTQLRSNGGGPWQYADGSQPSSDILTWSKEPNDYMGLEDCVAITTKLKWNDLKCGQSGGYVCEAQSGSGGCPKNWVNNNAGTCYFFGPSAANASNTLFWQAARDQCQYMAAPLVGTLLAIDNSDELNYVNSMLASRTSLNLFHWTALNDLQGEGVLTYADYPSSPADISILPWDQSPSCSGCSSACALINGGGYFEDFDCSQKRAFACERYATGYNGGPESLLLNSQLSFISLTLVIVMKVW